MNLPAPTALFVSGTSPSPGTDQCVAGLNWNGYNIYVCNETVFSYAVSVESLSSLPQFGQQGPATSLAVGQAVRPCADVLDGKPVIAALGFADASSRTPIGFQVLSATLTEDSFSFTSPSTVSLDLSLVTSLLPAGVSLQVTGFTSSVGPSVDGPTDTIYYFVTVKGWPGVYYFTGDGTTYSPLRVLPASVAGAFSAYNFIDIHAASVHLGNHGSGIALGGNTVDASGEIAPRVVVFSLSDLVGGSAAPYVQSYDLSQYYGTYANAIEAAGPGVSLLLCWGPCYADPGMMPGDVLTVFLRYDVDQDGNAVVYYTQLDLLAAGTVQPFSLAVPADNLGDKYGVFPVSFQVSPQQKGSLTASGGQYIHLFDVSSGWTQSNELNLLLNAWLLPSLLYVQTESPVEYPTLVDASMNAATVRAAVSTWGLIGVITGLPPYVPTDLANVLNDLSVTLGYSDSESNQNTVTSKSTALIGGSALGVSAQASWVWSSKTQTETSWSLGFSMQIEPAKSGEDLASWWAQIGYLVVLAPNYYRASFEVYNWDGVDTGLNIQLLWIDGGTVKIYDFDLKNPNALPPSPNVGPAPLYSFPVDGNGNPIAQWFLLNDFSDWSKAPSATVIGNSNEITPIPAGRPLEAISVSSSNPFSEKLDFSTATSQTSSTENTISVNASVNLFGLDFKTGFSIGQAQEVETQFSQSVFVKIEYPQCNDTVSSITIQPLFYQATASDLPWMPTILGKQLPWLLTWQVLSQDAEVK